MNGLLVMAIACAVGTVGAVGYLLWCIGEAIFVGVRAAYRWISNR